MQLGSGGALVLGSTSGVSLAIDQNEIMVRNGGGNYALRLQADGGTVVFGGPVDIGYQLVSGMSTCCAATAWCSAGTRGIGGGCDTTDSASTPNALVKALPFVNGADSGFHCFYDDDNDSLDTAWAICAWVP